jgi:hypothetical protein
MNMHISRRRRFAKVIFFVLPAFLVVLALLVWAVQSLWNGLMPAIFGLRAIGYWQALGLMVLSWILFGGLRGSRHSGGGRWRREMWERWERMTPEEREQLRKGLHGRWAAGGASSSPEPDAGPK